MMELRPMVVNADNIVLGGNMRLKALKELGYTDIPDEWVNRADELTEDETRRFIIADNVGFGEHDWEMLANEWDTQELEDWGLEGFPFEDVGERCGLAFRRRSFAADAATPPPSPQHVSAVRAPCLAPDEARA